MVARKSNFNISLVLFSIYSQLFYSAYEARWTTPMVTNMSAYVDEKDRRRAIGYTRLTFFNPLDDPAKNVSFGSFKFHNFYLLKLALVRIPL